MRAIRIGARFLVAAIMLAAPAYSLAQNAPTGATLDTQPSQTAAPSGIGNRCIATIKTKDGKVEKVGEDVTVTLDANGNPTITNVRADKHLKAGTCETTSGSSGNAPSGGNNSPPTNTESSPGYDSNNNQPDNRGSSTYYDSSLANFETSLLSSGFGEYVPSMQEITSPTPINWTEPPESLNSLRDIAYPQETAAPASQPGINNETTSYEATAPESDFNNFRSAAWEAQQQTMRDDILGSYANQDLHGDATFADQTTDDTGYNTPSATSNVTPNTSATNNPTLDALVPLSSAGDWAAGTALQEAQEDAAQVQTEITNPPTPCDQSCLDAIPAIEAKLDTLEQDIRSLYVQMQSINFTPGGSWALPAVVGNVAAAAPEDLQQTETQQTVSAQPEGESATPPAPSPVANDTHESAPTAQQVSDAGTQTPQNTDTYQRTVDARGYPEFCDSAGHCVYASQAPTSQEFAQASPQAAPQPSVAPTQPAQQPKDMPVEVDSSVGANASAIVQLLEQAWDRLLAFFTAPSPSSLPSSCSLFTSLIGGCQYK